MSDRPLLDAGDLASVDLADPAVHAHHDLSGVWRRLRAETPLHWQRPDGRGAGFWVLTRHADVSAAYRNAGSFTSERGNVLDTLRAGGDPAAGKMAAVTDGRHHAELRAVLLKAFTPRALQVVVDNIRSGTRKLLEDVVARGGCDFAVDVAANIPLAAICDLLGVPDEDRAHLIGLTSSALASDTGVPTTVDTWSAKNDILAYFADLADQRRESPFHDVVSMLVTAEIGGRPLSHDEVIANCYSLILGGYETTRFSMIGGVRALIEHPLQWRALCDGDVDVATAVEEVLRWTTPLMHAGRTAVRDVTLHDRVIRAGDLVSLWNVAANADERQFDAPDRFELSRDPNKHLTFAYGPHFCVGAYLARVELGAVLEGLRALAREVHATGPGRWVYSNYLTGMWSLPVAFTAR